MSLVEVKIDAEKRVADLILNRPEKLNCFNQELQKDFAAAFNALSANPAVSCIVISGKGRAFSTGYDLAANRPQPGAARPPERYDPVRAWQRSAEGMKIWWNVRESPVPVVAAVHGYCFGAAQMLATMSDVVVVADDTVLGWSGTGVRGGGGWLGPAVAFFSHHRRAREMELRYGRLTGQQAWEMGWANYSVSADEVLPLAHEIAEEISRTPRETLAVKKAAMNYVLDNMGYRRVIEAAAQWGTLAHGGEEITARDAHLDEIGLRAALREDAEIRATHTLLNRVTGMNVPTPSARPEQKTPVKPA